MTGKVIVGLTFGTLSTLTGIAGLIAIALLYCGSLPVERISREPIPFLHNRPVGDLRSHEANELQYGPVNSKAANEVKNGLIARFRAARQARQASYCQPCQQASCQQYSAPTYQACQPCQQVITICPPKVYTPVVVDPTDCTAAYQTQSVRVVSPSREYPEAVKPECSTCPTSPKIKPPVDLFSDPLQELKTGSFVCSRCKRPCIGDEWHTDWKPDGTPITFLCERCYSALTPQQRVNAYEQYARRQVAESGRSGLNHPETR